MSVCHDVDVCLPLYHTIDLEMTKKQRRRALLERWNEAAAKIKKKFARAVAASPDQKQEPAAEAKLPLPEQKRYFLLFFSQFTTRFSLLVCIPYANGKPTGPWWKHLLIWAKVEPAR